MSAKDVVLRSLISPVKDLMEETRAVLEREITDPSPSAQDMLDHISRFRGKQMRGALLLLSGEATGARSEEHPTMAAVVEMIHLATLVHDDVLDGAEVRRRVACVNLAQRVHAERISRSLPCDVRRAGAGGAKMRVGIGILVLHREALARTCSYPLLPVRALA